MENRDDEAPNSTIRAAFVAVSLALPFALCGCWAMAAGAGAETGYVVSQEDRGVSQTLDDQRITSLVKTKLLADEEVDGLDINVDTFKGAVTLRGFVDSDHEADTAAALARSVSGVRDVRTQLVMKERY